MKVFVVFDGSPGPEAGRFVEVETQEGQSVSVGEWETYGSGNLWRLGPFFTEPSRPAADFTAEEMGRRIARVDAACAEIGREIALRRSVYPRWVAKERLTQSKADAQISALEDAVALLRELSGVTR